jgi:hypothetical protein
VLAIQFAGSNRTLTVPQISPQYINEISKTSLILKISKSQNQRLFVSESFQKPRTRGVSLIWKIKKTGTRDYYQNQRTAQHCSKHSQTLL